MGGEVVRQGALPHDHANVVVLGDVAGEALQVAAENRVEDVQRRVVERDGGDAVIAGDA